MPGLLWVHNIYMVLLSLLLFSFSQQYDRYQIADDRAPLCNTTWSVNNFQQSAANYISEKSLSLPHTANPSHGLICRLLLYEEVFSYYWQQHRYINLVTMNCAIHLSWCTVLDLLHEYRQLPLEFITQKFLIQNFN